MRDRTKNAPRHHFEVDRDDRGVCFIGEALALAALADELRALAASSVPGAFLVIAGVTLVNATSASSVVAGRVCLPADAWNIAASKVLEVVTGREDSPFYFGDCGYLFDRPSPDFGVRLLGATVDDSKLWRSK